MDTTINLADLGVTPDALISAVQKRTGLTKLQMAKRLVKLLGVTESDLIADAASQFGGADGLIVYLANQLELDLTDTVLKTATKDDLERALAARYGDGVGRAISSDDCAAIQRALPILQRAFS